MKRIVSFAMCALMFFALVPTVFADGGVKIPDFPFELKAPEHVSLVKADSDSETTMVFNYSNADDIIAFFRAKDDAANSDLPGTPEEFIAPYGIDDVWIDIQGDWALDDVNDAVSGWHYRPEWDNKGENENHQLVTGPWDMFDGWDSETTHSIWITRGVCYDPSADRSESNDWLGNPDVSGSIGLKDQLREGSYSFNEDHYLSIDYTKHTLYTRCRYILTVRPLEGDDVYFFSDWSDAAAFGKDAAQWKPLVKSDVAAPDISNLEMTMDEFNGYPVVKFDLAVPDALAKAVTEVEARGGTIWLLCEGRVPGETNWCELQGDWIIKPGRMEMKLISLVDPEREENEGKVLITINTPLELRCRYWVEQKESYGGEYIGEFYSDYSVVLKLAGKDNAKGSGDVNGDGKLNAKDVTMLMKFLVGVKNDKFIEAEADFNGDAKINAKDVVAIMKQIVKG